MKIISMKIKVISNILLLFIVGNVFGQTKIEGILLDSFVPIKYVKVYVNDGESSTLTDINGYFEIMCNVNDTLNLESNKYENKSLIIENFNKLTIQLTAKQIELEEVIVSLFKIKKTINKYNKESKLKYHPRVFPPYYEEAIFIQNHNREKGLIKNVSICIPFGCNALAPFRINLYNVDLSTGLPGNSILRKDIILYPSKEMGWYKVNFDSLRILIPEFGFFFAVEALPFDGLIYKNTDSSNTINPNRLIVHEPLTLGTGINKLDNDLFYCARANKETNNWGMKARQWQKKSNKNSNHIGVKVDLETYSTTKPQLEDPKNRDKKGEEIETETLLTSKEVSKAFGVKIKLDTKMYPQGSLIETLESCVKSLKSDDWKYCFIYLMSNTFTKDDKTEYLDGLVNDGEKSFYNRSVRLNFINVLQPVIDNIVNYKVEMTSNNEFKICFLNGNGWYFLLIDNKWYLNNFFSIDGKVIKLNK